MQFKHFTYLSAPFRYEVISLEHYANTRMALIAQEQVGKRIFYIRLNTALQRTRAILLAVTFLYQPI